MRLLHGLKMYIIYKTTNTTNGKYYIGIHNEDANNQNGFYYGSGKALKAALKRYGKENFTRETLFVYNTLEEAIEKEKEIVTEEFVSDSGNYNLTVGGGVPPNSKTWWTETHSKKLSEKMKGNSFKLGIKESEETKAKKSKSMQESTTIGRWQRTEKHKKEISERARKQMLNNNPMSNQELRAKVAQTKIGNKKVVKEGVFKYARPHEIESFLNQGYVLARP